ncbi:MAG: response regulator transcription factor [Anaerolineales bacterium]|nr:response regulator transcription factor [Chloroflexota bacterium]MBL6980643.1 response regulator transcription factor [Anaerolineales bacterium]
MTETIRILICDDHLIVREGLRLILETESGFDLVGEANDGAQAIALAEELQPDVILMDLRMPGMDGLTAIELLRTQQPHIAIVILTTFNEDDLMRKGLGLGARGYLLKDTDRGTLFNTIRAAARGETLLKPEILENLFGGDTKANKSTARDDIELTGRELEVLSAVAQGERSKEIAYRLGITERTVKAHLSNIYSKLGVDSRAAAVSEAMQRGVL